MRKVFPEALRAEMVYGLDGKLRVVILAFAMPQERDEVMQSRRRVGERGLVMQRAYNRGARTRGSVRVIVHQLGRQEEHDQQHQEVRQQLGMQR